MLWLFIFLFVLVGFSPQKIPSPAHTEAIAPSLESIGYSYYLKWTYDDDDDSDRRVTKVQLRGNFLFDCTLKFLFLEKCIFQVLKGCHYTFVWLFCSP